MAAAHAPPPNAIGGAVHATGGIVSGRRRARPALVIGAGQQPGASAPISSRPSCTRTANTKPCEPCVCTCISPLSMLFSHVWCASQRPLPLFGDGRSSLERWFHSKILLFSPSSACSSTTTCWRRSSVDGDEGLRHLKQEEVSRSRPASTLPLERVPSRPCPPPVSRTPLPAVPLPSLCQPTSWP